MAGLRPLRAALLLSAMGLVHCGSPDEPPPVEAQGCDDPWALLVPNGECIRPGIASDGCAAGFTHDGAYGCEPILPAEDCPPGTMAVPGDTACRAVKPCGEGRWGNIPVDATTQYVDAAYRQGLSDGSAERPWRRIGEAVAAATSGTLVAIAAGTYAESVAIAGKQVRLSGVCPDKVTIVGGEQSASACRASICVLSGADSSEIRGVALTGTGSGTIVSGAESVLVEAVHVHDAALQGIVAQDAASLTLRNVLVEQNHDVGILVMGADARVEASCVRDTTAHPTDPSNGRGMVIQPSCMQGAEGVWCDPATRPTVTVQGSLVERNHDTGIFVAGADATIEASVVRTTFAAASTGQFGRGIEVQAPCNSGATGIECDAALRANVVMLGSHLDRNHDTGLFVSGSDVRVENCVVRDTLPRASDQRFGRGISIERPCRYDARAVACDAAAHASAFITATFVEANHDAGIFINGSQASLENIVVRNTASLAGVRASGTGISVHVPCGSTTGGARCAAQWRAAATLASSLVADNHIAGVFVMGSDAHLETSVVRGTLPSPLDGSFGDGATVIGVPEIAATLTIDGTRIDESARAGVASFGGLASLGSTHIHCAAVPLNGEPHEGQPFRFEDRGNNLCGCPVAAGACKVLSTDLVPPEVMQGE